MKYGVMGSFVKLAFANTVFDYLERRLPDLDMASYKRRALSEYKAIVARSPSVGPMRDNMFVVSMYAAAFVIALYKAEPELLTPDVLQGLVKAASYHAQAVWHLQTLRAGGSRPHHALPMRHGLLHLRDAGRGARPHQNPRLWGRRVQLPPHECRTCSSNRFHEKPGREVAL